jgi:uncharacterized membrane protein
MHSLSRHFAATIACVTIFSLAGTLNGFIELVLKSSTHDPLPSAYLTLYNGHTEDIYLTGLVNCVLITGLFLIVLTPVASIATYLFTYKWSLPIYIEVLAVIPLMTAYLFPWTLLLGRYFPAVLLGSISAFTLPMLLYWAIYKGLDRNFG